MDLTYTYNIWENEEKRYKHCLLIIKYNDYILLTRMFMATLLYIYIYNIYMQKLLFIVYELNKKPFYMIE
jgi:hypothetical protein